jgi:hypothetical protein
MVRRAGFRIPFEAGRLVREEVSSEKKDIEVDVGDGFGGGRRGGGESGVITIAVDKNTKYKFTLMLENKSKVELSNISLEYRIYYMQEKAVVDEKANKNRPEDSDRPDIHMAVEEEKVQDGRNRIKTLGPRQGQEISTTSVKVTKRSANRPWGENIDLKGEVHGAWIKLTFNGPDGKKLERDIAYPPSIPKKLPWDPPEEEESEADTETETGN